MRENRWLGTQSVKYKFGAGYWLPPYAMRNKHVYRGGGGKELCNNRLPGWADP